jgi:hypothetical protein
VSRDLAFALETLKKRHDLLKRLGPATDRPAEARAQLKSLEFAMEVLQKPHFPMNPFI